MAHVADAGLTVSGMTISYGGLTAVKDLSIAVPKGHVVAVVGPNGAGKSSLLRGISGITKPDRGDVCVDGSSLARRSAPERARRGLAHVPEGRRLFPQLTVRENLKLAALAGGAQDLRRVGLELERFPELTKLLDRRGESLSGGEQQLVAFLRALVQEPDVIMIDEPSLGLAPIMVDRVADAIAEAAASGKAVLLAEQNVELALRLASLIHVLHFGVVADVIELGTPASRDEPELDEVRQRVMRIILEGSG